MYNLKKFSLALSAKDQSNPFLCCCVPKHLQQYGLCWQKKYFIAMFVPHLSWWGWAAAPERRSCTFRAWQHSWEFWATVFYSSFKLHSEIWSWYQSALSSWNCFAESRGRKSYSLWSLQCPHVCPTSTVLPTKLLLLTTAFPSSEVICL